MHALLSIIGYRYVSQLFSLRGDGQLFSKSMNVTGIASLRGGKLGAALVKSGVRITAGGLKVRRRPDYSTDFCFCDNNVREKDWHSRARVTPARLPWRAHVACVPRLRQRQSFSRMHTHCFEKYW
jgi:hypothetical protein